MVSDPISSSRFGIWTRDEWGLPAFDYTVDERSDPRARNVELGGDTAAWHQVGNDRFVANAFNHGYVQVWSQDRDYQWMNRFEPARHQYAGGFGYLVANGRGWNTLALDRGADPILRRFGVGYSKRSALCGDFSVDEVLYAPFGDEPLLHHDVTIQNQSDAPAEVVWWEYWGVNPQAKGGRRPGEGFDRIQFIPRAVSRPAYEKGTEMLSVQQLPVPGDDRPLSIFATAVDAPVDGVATSVEWFFGSGTRQKPAAIMRELGSSPAPVPEIDGLLFAFRASFTLPPGGKRRLRYAYGFGQASELSRLVSEARSNRARFATSCESWRDWLIKTDLGPDHRWLERELAWAAYHARSACNYEDRPGRHVITEGGWYQYGAGMQLAFRDPLQHLLPMIHAEPWIAREVLLYSAQEQSSKDGSVPFSINRLGESAPPISCDDSLWLLLALTEYVFATRDFEFLDATAPWSDGGTATMWEHAKMAYRQQESFAGGPHGLYTTSIYGDWADGIVQHAGLTETTLVPAQLAYIYPRLADVALLRGDGDFAAFVRSRAEVLKRTVASEWVSRGWFSRGYAKDRQVGVGTIYGTPQGWGLIADAVPPEQARALVANIRRYLTGIGAPPELGGPSRIGSSHSPAADDPEMTEAGNGTFDSWQLGDNDAVYIPGTWFAINGYLTWALASLDGKIPEAREFAWDELKRNTLQAHAEAFPEHWNGTISVDDYCFSWYAKDSSNLSRCGWPRAQKSCGYYGLNTHQPAWLLANLVRMAGFETTAAGYVIRPRIPLPSYSMQMPCLGIQVSRESISGYFALENGRALKVVLHLPGDWPSGAVTLSACGKVAELRIDSGQVTFDLPEAGSKVKRGWIVSAR